MDVVRTLIDPPPLRRPVLIAAFEGWNDAGEAATTAAAVLRREIGAMPFAEIDAEEFFDFQHTRPMVRFDEDGARQLEWPENRFWYSSLPAIEHDVVLLTGTEPNLRWRTFTGGVVDLARRLGVELVLTLGALQVDAPHTRPVRVTGSASDPGLATRLGLRRSRYEGPTGITGVLHSACHDAGIEAASLWAGVPHYLAGTAYLDGALALAERTCRLLGLDVSLATLAADAVAQRDDIAELLAEDTELADYVAELEARRDDDQVHAADDDLPSGEQLAAELERFLRDRSEG